MSALLNADGKVIGHIIPPKQHRRYTTIGSVAQRTMTIIEALMGKEQGLTTTDLQGILEVKAIQTVRRYVRGLELANIVERLEPEHKVDGTFVPGCRVRLVNERLRRMR